MAAHGRRLRRRECGAISVAGDRSRLRRTQIMKPSDRGEDRRRRSSVQSAAPSTIPTASTATPPASPARPNQRSIFRARSAASDEPMITDAAQAAPSAANSASRRPASATAWRASRRGAAEHDDAREEAVRVEADEPRAQARRGTRGTRRPRRRRARSRGCGWSVAERRTRGGRARRRRIRTPRSAPGSRGDATTSANEADARCSTRPRAGASARCGSTATSSSTRSFRGRAAGSRHTSVCQTHV